MKPILSQLGREMRWRRTRMLPACYELNAGDETLATYASRLWFRRTAEITLAEGRWLIRPPRLLSWSLLVQRLDDDGGLTATYRGRWRGGDLTFESGENYTISRQGLIPLSVKVQNATGSTILTVHWHWPAIRNAGQVRIESAGSAEPHLGLLAAIAFHVLVLRRRRAARSNG